MLSKLIGKLRRQPKKTRDNVALGIASTFTFVVASFWLFNIPNTFDGMLSMDSQSSEQTENFMERMGEQTAAVKEALSTNEAASESLKSLVNEYQAAGTSTETAATSTLADTTTASSSSSTRSTSATTTSTPSQQEVRIQTITNSTTSTTTNE